MTAVCILAAGQGTRVGAFGGLLHKALLPLGPMAVLSHIILQMPKDARFVIAVGHLSEQVKAYVHLAHPDCDVTFVDVQHATGPGAGPGRSLWECREHLRGPFLLTAADTIVNSVPECGEEAWMGVSTVSDSTNWCTVKTDSDGLVTELRYRAADGGSVAYTGIAWVTQSNVFFRGLESQLEAPGEMQVNAGFDSLITVGAAPRAVPVEWTDTGTDDHYAAARKSRSGALDWGGKETDATYIVGRRVVKWFADPLAASGRVDRHLAGRLPLPPFIASAPGWLAYEYINGPTLAEEAGVDTTVKALDWAERELWKPLPGDASFINDCADFYIAKTVGRVELAIKNLGLPAEPSELRLNGVATRPVLENLEARGEEILASAIPSTFHGDFHDGNVVNGAEGLVAIDWRDRFGASQVRGDRFYDLAKFLHTLELSHEVMNSESFRISRTDQGTWISHEDCIQLRESRAAFWAWSTEHNYSRFAIGVIDALVFCNMAPLYQQPLGEYLYLLGRLLLHSRLSGEDAIDTVFDTRKFDEI